MMKKLQFLLITMMLLLSVHVNADEIIVNSNLDLYNPDVRKCLLDATKQEGWELKSVYLNSEDKLIMIFDKGNDTKIYKTK
jgi:hypothetical protein